MSAVITCSKDPRTVGTLTLVLSAHSRWLLAAGELHGLMLDMATRHVVYALDLLRVVYKIRAGLERRPYQSQEVSKHKQNT